MNPIAARHLTTIRFQSKFPPHELGETPYGRRRIVPTIGGKFTGERLSGVVLPVGPPDLYYSMSGRFECASDSAYAWLNNIVTVMRGIAAPTGSDYEVHEVL